jgi:hypothetical protein
VALISGDDSVRADPPGPRTECRRRLERMLTIGAEAAQLERRIADLVAATGTTLTEQHGVGSLVARGSYPKSSTCAAIPTATPSLPRTAPPQLPASSGRTIRHRFNPRDNGQMNRALYTIALTPQRHRRPRLTTNANAAPASPNAKRCDASSGGWPTSCSPPWAATPPKVTTPPAHSADPNKGGYRRK